MQLAPRPSLTLTIPRLLLVALGTMLALAGPGCARPARVVLVRIPCVATPPPEPPPETAGAEALAWYEAQITAWAWGAWDACRSDAEGR